MSRLTKYRVAWGSGAMAVIATVVLGFLLNQIWEPASAEGQLSSGLLAKVQSDLASADALLESGDLAGAALSYVALMDSHPGNSASVLDERLDDIGDLVETSAPDTSSVAALMGALPPLDSMGTPAGRYALLRLVLLKLAKMSNANLADMEQLRASTFEALLESLWETPSDPYTFDLAAEALDLAEAIGPEQVATLVTNFQTHLSSATSSMGTLSARVQLMKLFESSENWSARNGLIGAVLTDAVSESVIEALSRDDSLPHHRASVLSAQVSAELLSGDYVGAVEALDSVDWQDDPDTDDNDFPPAVSLTDLGDSAAKSKLRATKTQPSTAEGLPLTDRVDVLDTQNPILRFRMRLPGAEVSGDPELAGNQRIVEVHANPVFYPDEDDSSLLKPVKIELNEEIQADGSTAWMEDRNTLKYLGDSKARQFYRLGEYKLRIAPLFAGSESAVSAVLRQRLASQPSEVTRSGGGILAAEGILGDGVDFMHETVPGMVKEFVTLQAVPDLPVSAARWILGYRWSADGLTPVLLDGEVHWKNAGGDTVLRFPAPVAWDAAGASVPISYVLRNSVVALVVPAQALRTAVYPVVLDPTVTTGASDLSANLSTRYKVSGEWRYKSMYGRLALPDLTGFSSIDQATFYAKIQSTDGGAVATSAYCDAKGTWTESTSYSTLEAFAFPNATASQSVSATSGWVNWNVLGSTSTTGIAKIYASDSSPDPATVKVFATSYTGTPNSQTVELTLAESSASPYRTFHTRTASSGNAPYLQIVYTLAPAAPTSNFTANVTSGEAPLNVSFSDTSNGNGGTINAWSWTFGDGGTSTSQNPTHAFTAPGTYTVALTVTSAGGSDGETKTSYITVADTTPPVFTLLGPNPYTIEYGDEYVEYAAEAIDTVDGDISEDVTIGGDTVNTEVLGDYTVTYDVEDSHANAATTLSRFVSVVDTTPPELSLIGDNPLEIEYGLPYVELGASATDVLDGDLTEEIIIGGEEVLTGQLGEYSVTYDVEDSHGNNAEQVVRVVEVVDTIAPTLTLNGDDPMEIELGATFTDPMASAQDAVYGDLSSSIEVGGDTVDPLTVGEYVITYDVTDPSGNSADTITRLVRVFDPFPDLTVLGPVNGSVQVTQPPSLNVVASGAPDTTFEYPHGSTVRLEAIAEPGYTFWSWGEDLPTGRNTIVFEDSFPDEELDSAWTVTGGDWSVTEGGTLRAIPSANEFPTISRRNVASDFEFLYAYNRKSDTGSLWHYLRWEDDENYLLLQISESHIRLREMDNGLHEYLLVSREMPSHIDNWYAISVRCEGEAVTIERTPAGGSKEEVISYTGVQTSGTSQAIFSTYAGVSFELDNVFLRNLRNSAYLEMVSSMTVSATFIQADTTAPVISLLGNSSIELACGENFVDPGATATDARYGDLTSRILVGGNTGTFTEPGTYTITYNVSDEEGNAAQEVTRTVIITADSTPPEISLNGESIVYLRKGDDYEELGAIALDACQGEVEVDLDSSSVNTAVFGTYIVEYDAVDTSGNIAQTVHREVRVWPTLSITIEGEGTTDPGVPADGEYLFFEPGSTASISAVQTEPSSVFDRWYGAGNGGISASSRTILMSTSQSVTAKFVAARELVIQFFGEGSLQYGTDGSITEPETPETVYLHPSERTITVSAVPEEGISEFVQWALGSEAAIYEPTSVIDIGPLLHQGEKKYLNATFAPIGTVDYFDVTLTVEGNGTTIPAPGIYRIPRFKQLQPECFLACQEETNPMPEGCFGCNVGNSFLVGAEADANWVLKGWQAPGHVEVEPRLDQKFQVEDDITITAQFIERPGATELDLFTAVGELFVEAGEISSTSELYTTGLDYGEFQFDSAGDLTWTGNGIPDAAEISLLLSVLVNPHLDLSRFGGVAHTFVWEDFATNQARAALDLPSQTVNIQNAVAAYMTLGSYGHVEKLIELVASTYSVTLDSQDYVSSSVELFKPDGDADGDGIPNNLEWQLTPVHSGASGPSLGAWSYPLWALNPELPMSGPALAGASVVSSVKAISSAAPALSLANSVVDCDCPDGSLATSLVTLTDSADVTVAHRLSCGNLVLGTPTSVKRGRAVTLSATEAFPGAFVKWNAPGTLIHGSALRRETLSITEDTVSIAPSVMDMPVVTIYDPNAIVTVLRGSAAFVTTELVPDSLDPDGIEIQAPQGTLLQVTCSNCDGWEATENQGGNAITRDRNIVFPMGFDDMTQLYPLSEFSNPSNLPYRRFTHYASTDGGGSALIGLDGGGTHGTVVPFLGQATERSYWGATPPSASQTIKLLARENPGYQFRQWIGLTSGSTSHSPSVSFATEDASSHLNAQAIFVAKSTLQWQSKAFGASSSMRGDCFGYCRVSPAQKYYDLPVGSAGPEIVQVIAVPQPGYSFEKWVGLGEAWTSAVNDNGEWASVSGASEAISGCDNETIYLKMANSENGPVDHNLYAVYSRDEDNGTGGSGIKLTVDVHGLGHAILSPEPDPHTGYYAANTLVTVTQEADTDWQFEKWDGQVDDGQDPESESVQVTMSASKTIDLFFQNKWTLKLNIIGEGSAARVPDQPNYETGTDVVCTATAASGWQFTGWKAKTQEGDRTENPTTVNMDFNKEFDVVFLKERLLTVNVAFDDGTTVTPGAGGSVQTSTGSSIYLDGQKALLEVYPSFGNVLARWEGPNGEEVTEEGLYAALVMNDDKEITAIFEDGYTLSALVNGPGTVSMAPVAQAYRLNQQVGVTVHPAPGWSFAGWIGDTTGIADTGAQATTVTVSGDMTIHAAVTRDNYALTLQSEGPGMIEAVPNAPTYPSFDVVELVPTALPGTKFDHWENGEGVRLREYATEVPLRLTMDGPKTIRGVFRDKAVLHIESEELIVQDPLPGEDGTYPLGTEVTLTAAPAVGKLLSNWEGDAGQTSYDPLVAKVKMDSDKWVLVTFEDAHLLTVNTITGASATTWPGESKDYIQSAPLPQFWFRANSDTGQTLEEGQFVGYLPVTTETVTLKARDTVGDGQVFHHWEDTLGVKLGRDLELELEIYGDTTVNAVYIDQGPRLTVNMLGEGTVTINDDLPKEYRGLRAKRNYSEDDEVSIHAEPIPGYYFDHWVCSDESADLHDTTGDLELTLTEDSIVSAIFIPEDDLIVFDGDVNEDGTTNQADVDIVRSAIATKSSAHSKADSNGDGDYDLFDLKWAIDAKAGRNQEYMLFLDTEGLGHIEVTASGASPREVMVVDYKKYPAGVPVILHAIPESGWRFDRWAGSIQSRSDTVTVAMSSPNRRIYAKFVQAEVGENHTDGDNDGLSAYQESLFGTDPDETDTDGDGLPDGWEIDNSLNPKNTTGNHGANGDQDQDGLSNLEEYQQGMDPLADEERHFKVFTYSDGDGEVTLELPQGGYKQGQSMYPHAAEGANAEFDRWEGDLTGTEKAVDPKGVYSHAAIRGRFRSEKSVIVHDDFAQGRFSLDSESGLYIEEELAHIGAFPGVGEKFAGWSGTVKGIAASLNFEVDRDHFILPHFDQDYFSISLLIEGDGQKVDVSIDGQPPTSYLGLGTSTRIELIVIPGQEVELTAKPDVVGHWTFDSWKQTRSEARSESLLVLPTANDTIIARFLPTFPVEFSSTHSIDSYLEFIPKPSYVETSQDDRIIYYPPGTRVSVRPRVLPANHDGMSWLIMNLSNPTSGGTRYENGLQLIWPNHQNTSVQAKFVLESGFGTNSIAPFITVEEGLGVGVTQILDYNDGPDGIVALTPHSVDGQASVACAPGASNVIRLFVCSQEPTSWFVKNKFGDVVAEMEEGENKLIELDISGAPYKLKTAREKYYLTNSPGAGFFGIGEHSTFDILVGLCEPENVELFVTASIGSILGVHYPCLSEGATNSGEVTFTMEKDANVQIDINTTPLYRQYEVTYTTYLEPWNDPNYVDTDWLIDQGIHILPSFTNRGIRPTGGMVLSESLWSDYRVWYDFRGLMVKEDLLASIDAESGPTTISNRRIPYRINPYKLDIEIDLYHLFSLDDLEFLNGLNGTHLPYSRWSKKIDGENRVYTTRYGANNEKWSIDGPTTPGNHEVTYEMYGNEPTPVEAIQLANEENERREDPEEFVLGLDSRVVYPDLYFFGDRLDKRGQYSFTIESSDFGDHSQWLDAEIVALEGSTSAWLDYIVSIGEIHYPGTEAGRPFLSKVIEKVTSKNFDKGFNYANPDGTSDPEKVAFFMFEEEANHKLIDLEQVNSILYGAFLRYIHNRNVPSDLDLGISEDTFEGWRNNGRFQTEFVEIGWRAAQDLDILNTNENASGGQLLGALDPPGYKWPPEEAPYAYIDPWDDMNSIVFEDLDFEVNEFDNCRGQILDDWIAAGNGNTADWEDSPVPTLTVNVIYPEGVSESDIEVNVDVASCAPREIALSNGVKTFTFEGFAPGTTLTVAATYADGDYFVDYSGTEPNAAPESKDYAVIFTVDSKLDWQRTLTFEVKKAGHFSMSVPLGSLGVRDMKAPNQPIVVSGIPGEPQLIQFPIYDKTGVHYRAENDSTRCFLHWALAVDEEEPVYSGGRDFTYDLLPGVEYALMADEAPDCERAISISTSPGGGLTATLPSIGEVTLGPSSSASYTVDTQSSSIAHFVAEPISGYRFTKWVVNGEAQYPEASNNTLEYDVVWENNTIAAEFRELALIKIKKNGPGPLHVTPLTSAGAPDPEFPATIVEIEEAEVIVSKYGKVKLEMKPLEGWEIIEWTPNATALDCSTPVTSDATIAYLCAPEDMEEVEVTLEFDPDALPSTDDPSGTGVLGRNRNGVPWGGTTVSNMPPYLTDPNFGDPSSCPTGQDDFAPAGDPVHLYSGEVYLHEVDLHIPNTGGGPDFIWSRTYRSRFGENTDIGNGWDYSYNIRVEEMGPADKKDAVLLLRSGNGRKDYFDKSTSGEPVWTRPEFFTKIVKENSAYKVIYNDGSSWTMYPLDGSVLERGRIKEIRGRLGHFIAFEYYYANVDNQVPAMRITGGWRDPANLASTPDVAYEIKVNYKRNTLGSAQGYYVFQLYENPNRLPYVTYQRSLNGDLISAIPLDKFNEKTYTYDTTSSSSNPELRGNLLSIKDAKGNTYVENTYYPTTDQTDPNYDRIHTQRWGSPGDNLEFSYSPQQPTQTNRYLATKTTVTDRRGNQRILYFDTLNRGIREDVMVEDASGQLIPYITRQFWDDNSLLVRKELPNGTIIGYTYDKGNDEPRYRGRLLRKDVVDFDPAFPLDSSYTSERFAYGDENCGCDGAATDHWDGNNNHTEFVYNDKGNVEEIIRPDGTRETFQYVASGLFTGRLEEHHLPENESGYARVLNWKYNYYDDSESIEYWDGDRHTTTEFNHLHMPTDWGKPTKVVDAKGATTYYRYNQNRLLWKEFKETGDGTYYGTIRSFDANGNVKSVASGKVIGNANQQLYFTFDPVDWQLTEFTEYDILNRPKQMKKYNGGSIIGSNGVYTNTGGEAITTELDYDANGNLTLLKTGQATLGLEPNNIIEYEYDERNLVTEVKRGGTDAKAVTTGLKYDEIGNLREKSVGNQVTTFFPDGFGRTKTVTDAMGNVLTNIYDRNGNIKKVLIEGELDDAEGGTNNTRLAEVDVEFDAMNRPFRRLVRKFDPALTSDPAEMEVETTTDYNALGQPIEIKDDSGYATIMRYNVHGELETLQRGHSPGAYSGSQTNYEYDKNGNLEFWEKGELFASQVISPPESQSATYQYDALNRPLWTFSSGKQEFLTYDSRSNVTKVVDAEDNEFYYTYDNLNRPLTASSLPDPEDPTIFAQDWDHNNRLLFKKDGDGNQTDYQYNALDRLKRMDFAGQVVGGGRPYEEFGYDALGRLETHRDRNGATVTAHYDKLNRLTQRDFVASAYDFPVFTHEYFKYDGASRMVEARNDYSKVLMRHDSMGNLLGESLEFVGGSSPAGPFEVSHVYDTLGRPTTTEYPGARSLSYSYNIYNQDLSQILEGDDNLVNYAYYTHDIVGRKNLGPVVGTVLPGQYYPGSWNDDLPATEPAASLNYGFRAMGDSNPTHRIGLESLQFEFNRSGGVSADPQNPPPLTYDDRTLSYGWDQNFNKTSVQDTMPGFLPAPRTSAYEYDHLNRLADSNTQNSAMTSSMSLDYNDLGRLGNRDTVSYVTDTYSGGHIYERDPDGPDPNSYVSSATTSLLGNRSQSYDDNGNLVTIDDGSGNTRTFGYDPHNRLVHHSSTVGLTTKYLYDALGRRIQSTVVHNPSDTSQDEITRYLYGGHRVIEERDKEHNVLASYVYGRGLDEVVSMRRDVLDGSGEFEPDGTPEDYFYLGDMQNNTLVLVDSDGQMVESYAYGTELRPYAHFNGNSTAHQYPNDFGMPVILDDNGAVLHANFAKSGLPTHYQSTDGAAAGTPYRSRYGNPWLFNGRAWDAELGLYHYRNRYLDPVQGRFTTRDPIGLWGDPMNLGNGYSYVGNNPGTYVDPFELESLSPIGVLRPMWIPSDWRV